MSEDSIEFSLSIAEQRAVGFIPAWSLAFLQHPDYETVYCQLGHISDEAIRHISDNTEGAKKICFPNKKHVCCSCALGKLHQCSFPENPKYSSETLGLIHSDLLKLSTLSYSKYK